LAQAVTHSAPQSSPLRSLWQRQLPHYPETGPRTFYLGVVVLATIILYYEAYVGGSVATQVATDFHMSLKFLIMVSVIANLAGAFASLIAGLADRWGRANLVAFGLLATGLLTLFALPHASNKGTYMFLAAVVGVVEGMTLVATPALIRDFSPQLGRASAMGFWTLGPVLGSLIVTEVSSHTLQSHPDWQFQYYVAGVVGLIVWAIAFLGLRELAPSLRDQLMVSMQDRALIEARAAGIDPEEAISHGWRQMLTPSIIGPAFAISIFLLFYYIMVGFLVVYFATNFGYTPARANGLGNWYWIANAIALVVAGVVSDKLRVRKPLMVFGGVASAVGVAIFAVLATHPHTSYYTFAWLFVLISTTSGIAYCAWMAAFTETVEKKNPAATAHGLAVWGWTIRMVVVVSLVAFMFVVTAASTLVDHGAQVATLAAKYKTQLATIAKVDPATMAALQKNPADPAAGAKAVSEISGVSVAQVAAVAQIEAKYPQQIETLQAIDTQTATGLFLSPTTQLQVKAIGEIAQRLNVSPAVAGQRLTAVGAVPKVDLLTLAQSGTKVATAAAELKAAGTIPPADAAYLAKYGAKTEKAAKDSPKQWQTWWWVCFAGQLLFLPFIFLLAGRWSPRRAREDALAHEQAVQRELAALGSQEGAGARA
jgi:ACS family D-galactonate transporter-like MFS transporter